MVCDSFSPNPFKKDFCKNCQKSLADHPSHHAPPLASSQPPCSDFQPNLFKPDFCKNCQQGKKLHAAQSQTQSAKATVNVPPPVEKKANEPPPNPVPKPAQVVVPIAHIDSVAKPAGNGATVTQAHFDPGCSLFEPNPFKPTLCKNCRRSFESHQPPKIDKPQTVVVETCGEGPCGNFEPNPFKPDLCKTCRLNKNSHQSQQVQPVQTVPSTKPAISAPAPAAPAPAAKKAPAKEESSDDDDTPAKPAAKQGKPAAKRSGAFEMSDDDDVASTRRNPVPKVGPRPKVNKAVFGSDSSGDEATNDPLGKEKVAFDPSAAADHHSKYRMKK